jgi:asparagine synthetase B (glutamine-hydrolysing)
MPGMMGLIGLEGAFENYSYAASALDLFSRRAPRAIGGGEARMALATLPDPPLTGPFHYEDSGILACFAGDLNQHESVPWDDIVRCTHAGTFDWTQRADGHFAAAVYLKREKKLLLFGDHFGCEPIFYARHGRGLVFSTNMAAFVRLGVGGGFDREWFYRFLYFGYWPGPGTFLEGVKRVPPGTVLRFDVSSGDTKLIAYEERFAAADPPLRGREAVDKALETFRAVVPRMFSSGRRVQIGLSGGLDSRAVFAFVPKHVAQAAVTYGMPGCHDQREAARVARRMGIRHRQLFFDEEYVKTLPSLVLEAIWLSGGLAWVNRGMLPAVYRFVAEESGPSPIHSSGIALDTLFRGHNNARGDVNNLLATGEVGFTDPSYAEIVPEENYSRFQETVSACVDDLTREHGKLSRSVSYLSYTAYTLCPSYFTADLEICGHYATLRIPGFDRAIVELAYLIEYSTIYLSKYLPHDLFDEYILEANLMASHPELARIPLHGIPLDAYVRRSKLKYHAYRTVNHGMRYFLRRMPGYGSVALESWEAWFRGVLASQVRAVLNRGCLVADHVRPKVLETYANENRWRWLARLVTVEVILQLMANGWELAKLSYPGVRGRAVDADPFLFPPGGGGRT